MLRMIGIMLRGAGTSLEVFFLTLIFSLPLALPVTLGRMSKNWPLKKIVGLYLLVMRGTPLILQLIFIYFGPKYLLQFLTSALSDSIRSEAFWAAAKFLLSYNRFTAVIIAFVLNYAAYFAEIYRGGIESLPKGQYEAAKVLGFTRAQTFMRIVLPQMVKRILPATGNEVITLVKDTALAQVIGVAELFHAAQNAASREFSTMPIFVAGLFYLLMNWVVTVVFSWGEKKLSYYS
ncbi:amino acid ABC transporter permease [Leadbettera azotonutricia]|uniref:L-cystine transport system permease protein TcyB n=1 Tax=Leadbettera azotonutricia (strain ATCC BAA-888 / DSM 13862 / ZAS-9) TaxID=545695 RepID=F5YG24_LEAAZ|nr:amino acid ABC transporter permease [Leadbettera azotonutricia]AEF81664.1 L-cystine transport system permease protein TcyB [Leadbettera azotonutricia ZAS-9]